jgi:endoglucanase
LGFEIGQTVWKDAFYVSARGFFHQRNGIALGPPYTDYVRPRPFLPDDGVKVYQSNVALMDVDMGLGEKSAFEALVENRTDEIVPNAWGGYFDAGDWDRRAQHLEATRALLELAELFPEYFSTVDLNIPESQNALPDIVDEALWNLDFFKRLQTPEGGVRGGIETSEHPELGETSWENSLDVFAYAPDIWSSYLYAGVAARAAHWLVLKDPDLAMAYRNSAVKAMQWAEQEWHRSQHRDLPIEVNDERNLAALELYRLTGDRHWHQLFLSTTAFTDPNAPVFLWEHHEQRNAAFLYARLQDLAVNSTVQANAARALQREADDLAAFSAGTGFKWSKADPYTQLGWGDGLGVPQTESLIRAHVLTGKRRYLRAAILAAQFSAGANPDNMTFTSGVGLRSPKHPFVIDARLTHQAIPGITVYGSANLDKLRDKDWFLVHHLRHSQVSPNPWNWPITEGYFDTYWFIMQNEFTVHEAIAPTAYTWGYLAARAALRE